MVGVSVCQMTALRVSMAAHARPGWVSVGYESECLKLKGAVCEGPVLVPTRSAKVIMTLQRDEKSVWMGWVCHAWVVSLFL